MLILLLPIALLHRPLRGVEPLRGLPASPSPLGDQALELVVHHELGMASQPLVKRLVRAGLRYQS